eukprot:scaffold1087_cov154-Amphora_coffeaeformis.AAC.5
MILTDSVVVACAVVEVASSSSLATVWIHGSRFDIWFTSLTSSVPDIQDGRIDPYSLCKPIIYLANLNDINVFVDEGSKSHKYSNQWPPAIKILLSVG